MSTRQRISFGNGRTNGRVALPELREDLSLSKASLLYAVEFQLCIFPVLPFKKRPAYGGHGWKSATGNEVQIKRWWSENPNYNIGIALPFSGLAVLDIDPRHGGDRNLAALIEQYGPLPNTYVVATGGGGHHYYFRFEWDPDCDYPKKLAEGVELLRNGYVVAPPSDTSRAESGGGLYRVDQFNDGHLAPLPTRWVDAVIGDARRRADDERLLAAEDWFLAEGERNEQITRYMGAMRRYGFTADELVAMVEAWGPDRIESFEEIRSELPTIARSVARYAPDAYGFESVRISVRKRSTEPELDERALQGPVGDYIKFLRNDHGTECHPAALLMQALAMFGNRIGPQERGDRAPGFKVAASHHLTSLYCMVVGESGTGAKGDSYDHAYELLKAVDPAFEHHEGVQTGEGFIKALADDLPLDEHSQINGEPVQHFKKGGQRDRRYFNFEPEYGRVLHVSRRQGSVLRDVARALWDHGSTGKITAAEQHVVTGALLTQVAHITPAEMERDFDTVDLMTGYGNRFLFCWSRRVRHIPSAQPVSAEDLSWFAEPLRDALEFAHSEAPEDYPVSEQADKLWIKLSDYWEKEQRRYPFAMVRPMFGRARPQVKRLAVIYAVADQQPAILVQHLRAAAAVFDYSIQTVEYCLGDTTGNSNADRMWRLVSKHPEGLTDDEIAKAFGTHMKSTERHRALEDLQDHGRLEKVSRASKSGRGRPATVWVPLQ